MRDEKAKQTVVTGDAGDACAWVLGFTFVLPVVSGAYLASGSTAKAPAIRFAGQSVYSIGPGGGRRQCLVIAEGALDSMQGDIVFQCLDWESVRWSSPRGPSWCCWLVSALALRDICWQSPEKKVRRCRSNGHLLWKRPFVPSIRKGVGRILPLIATLWLFLATANLLGVIPGLYSPYAVIFGHYRAGTGGLRVGTLFRFDHTGGEVTSPIICAPARFCCLFTYQRGDAHPGIGGPVIWEHDESGNRGPVDIDGHAGFLARFRSDVAYYWKRWVPLYLNMLALEHVRCHYGGGE